MAAPESDIPAARNAHGTLETPLTGGNASESVVRAGNTVRKPWRVSTPLVAGFANELRERGIDVPAHLGRDGRGRQIIEFVPGALAMDTEPLALDGLRRAGRMVRALHEAAASIPAADLPRRGDVGWEVLLPAPLEPGEEVLICHNDLAPWNLIRGGERWVFIDLDGAGPSTRAWDLAYAAQAFAGLWDGADMRSAAQRLRAFAVEGYRADPVLRARLPALLGQRSAAMRDLLRRASETGREPWATMHVEGHGEHWRLATDFTGRHEAVWRGAIA